MKNDTEIRKKIGDVLCDIGKYMLTVIPFTYLMSDKPGGFYVTIATAVFGVLLVILGLYFIRHSSPFAVKGNSSKRRIRILKNSVFVVEEEK